MARRPLCLCGHSWSCHRGAEHTRHRRGECKAVVPTAPAVFESGGALVHEPCGCAVYEPQDVAEPAVIPAGAFTTTAFLE